MPTHPSKPILQIVLLLVFAGSWGCRHSSGNRFPSSNSIPLNSNPVQGYFNSDDDSICVLARNANTINREIAVILPSGNEGILIPFGKPWAGIGSATPELGQSFYQVQILGGVFASQATRQGNWPWVNDMSKFGGGYYNGTSGSIVFTIPSGATAVGLYDLPVSSSGIFRVEIDGDRTLANHLPNAAALVSNGTLPANCLVNNGGTLQPDDKVFYQKSPAGTSVIPSTNTGFENMLSQSRRIRIASGLPTGIHTIKLIQSGYQANGSTANNLRISGIWFHHPAVGIGDAAIGFEFKNPQQLYCPSSDNNFAFRYRPQGFTASSHYEWLGHNNGSQIRTMNGILKLDGNLISDLPMGTLRRTHTMLFEVFGSLYHPLVSDPVAQYSQTYTITSAEGIVCHTKLKWNFPGHISLGYIPQLAAFDGLNKATVWEATQNYWLDENNDANRYNQQGTLAYMWSPASNWAMLLQSSIMDTIWLADRSDQYNKIYFKHYQDAMIQANDSISLLANYRFKKLDNADGSLSK